MENTLNDKQMIILAVPDSEDREVFYPLYRFIEAGAKVTLAGLGVQLIKKYCLRQ